jgi:uncharacterized protein (DUF1697 family)
MQTWIALFRGINVGGKNILPMAELRSELESLGFQNVRTYIQSGNVVFEKAIKNVAAQSKKIALHVEQRYGFRPHVLLLTAEDLQRAVQANPFGEVVTAPKTLHFFFLAEAVPGLDLAGLSAIQSPTENFQLVDRVFYLHAPDGAGRSKLAAKVEKYLGVPTTARNYRTVAQLITIAGL